MNEALGMKVFKEVGSAKIFFSLPLPPNLRRTLLKRSVVTLSIVMPCKYTGGVSIKKVSESSLGYGTGGECEDIFSSPLPIGELEVSPG